MPISGSFYFWGEKARNVLSKAAVYELYDEKYQLIFVGEGPNLKERFAEYLETHFSKKDPCKAATKYYKREFTSNTKERKKEILEEYIIKNERRRF